MPPYLRVDVYGLLPHHISKHTAERFRRPLELDHLARELVDSARHVGITPKDLGLYLFDIVLEAVDYGPVVINDTVHDGVQDRLGSTAQVLGVGLQLLAYPAQVRRLAVAHAHYEVFSHKEVDFAELDPLLLVQVAGRLEHDKERIPVALQLGPLVGVRRILDRQTVQAELSGDGRELLYRRLVEADPCNPAPVSDRLIGLLEGYRLGGTVAVHVDGIVHDHSRIIRPRLFLLVCFSPRRRACGLSSSVSPSKTANAAPWGSPRTAILPEGRSKGPASTVPPSPLAFCMAASREETPIHNQQTSKMEPGYPILDTTPMALTGCALSPPEGHQVMLQAYFQKTSRPRCGLFGRALSRVIDRATFCLFCPAAGTVAEASTTRISCSTFSRSSNTVVSRSSG